MKLRNLVFPVVSMLVTLLLIGYGVVSVQAQGPDVGIQANTDVVVNVLEPSVDTDTTNDAIDVEVGDTVVLPIQVGTNLITTTVVSDVLTFVDLVWTFPDVNVIDVLGVDAVTSNFVSGLSNVNIFESGGVTTVAFRVEFFPTVPDDFAPFTVANIRFRAEAVGTNLFLVFDGTSSRAGYTVAPNNAEQIGPIDVSQVQYKGAAPTTAGQIPINVTYPQMTLFIDDLDSPPGYNISVGETLATQVLLDSIVGVTEIEFELDTDASIVALQSVTPATGWTLASFDATNNSVLLESSDGDPVFITSESVVATLNWEGIAPGSLGQTFISANLYDLNGNLISTPAVATSNGGTITVDEQNIRLFLNPADVTIDTIGGTVVQYVETEGVFNVGQLAFELVFDEEVVEVADVQVQSLYSGGTVTFQTDSNTIKFSYNGARVSEDGEVIEITWRAVREGSNRTVAFNNNGLVVADSNSNDITPTTEPGTISVTGSGATVTPTPTSTPDSIATPTPTTTPDSGATATPTPTNTPDSGATATPTPIVTVTVTPTPDGSADISGVVEAEGRRPNFGGIEIFASTASCDSFDASGAPLTTTSANGNFALSNSSYQCLAAERVGHLSAELSNPSGDVGTTVLLAGDLNGDDVINIIDLSTAASLYQESDAVADFNATGLVDILDLSLIAKNYNLSGPTAW